MHLSFGFMSVLQIQMAAPKQSPAKTIWATHRDCWIQDVTLMHLLADNFNPSPYTERLNQLIKNVTTSNLWAPSTFENQDT